MSFTHYHVLSGNHGYVSDSNWSVLEHEAAQEAALEWANNCIEDANQSLTEEDGDADSEVNGTPDFTELSDYYELPDGAGAEYVEVSECDDLDCGIEDSTCIACDRNIPRFADTFSELDRYNPSNHEDGCTWLEAANEAVHTSKI